MKTLGYIEIKIFNNDPFLKIKHYSESNRNPCPRSSLQPPYKCFSKSHSSVLESCHSHLLSKLPARSPFLRQTLVSPRKFRRSPLSRPKKDLESERKLPLKYPTYFGNFLLWIEGLFDSSGLKDPIFWRMDKISCWFNTSVRGFEKVLGIFEVCIPCNDDVTRWNSL